MTTRPKASALDPSILQFIEAVMQREHPKSYLIAVLHKIQDRYGYLSQVHMAELAQRMQIPASTISGVSTFYHFFRLRPRGRVAISLCMGTACFVKGADRLMDAFRAELGIELGETTQDGIFSLETTRCLGVCGLAPVVTFNGRVFSNVSPQQVPELLNKVRSDPDAFAEVRAED
mgnify:CR=1 FL=1